MSFGEDGKSVSAGVGFRKGNLRPHSRVSRKIADPRVSGARQSAFSFVGGFAL
jgi:hypothetical protein